MVYNLIQKSNVLNIVILGEKKVGKTCLTYKFRNLDCPASYNSSKEEIIDFLKDIKGKKYGINILDTSGAEEYKGKMEEWIKFGDGFILVYAINNKNSFDLLKEIYESILKIKNQANIPMIIVGNKLDLETERQVPQIEALKLAESWGINYYVETSVLSNINCNEVLEKLVELMNLSK